MSHKQSLKEMESLELMTEESPIHQIGRRSLQLTLMRTSPSPMHMMKFPQKCHEPH